VPSNNNTRGPKVIHIDQKDDGQAFNHELDSSRDWEQTLDVLHHELLTKPYYIAIATNTRGGVFNPVMKKGITVKRIKKDVPVELQLVLKMQTETFTDLSQRIQEQSFHGNNKDVWHFRKKWKELPKGTAIIALRQQPLWNLLSAEKIFRRAYIILDGETTVDAQNHAMFFISKVLHNKDFANKIAKGMGKKAPVKEAKIKQRPKTIYSGRPVGGLILLLKESFGIHVRTLSIEERIALGYYFQKLKLTGEQDESHLELHEKMKRFFKTKDLRKMD